MERWDEIVARLPAGDCSVVEVGVWQAACVARVLQAHNGVTVHCVDPWRAARPGEPYALSGSTDSLLKQADFDLAYLQAVKRLSPYGSRAVIHRQTSAEASLVLCGVDLVYIDGDHSYDGCREDIRLWQQAVKPGGWLGGHDYSHPRFPGVTRAVREAFPDWADTVIDGADHTWWRR